MHLCGHLNQFSPPSRLGNSCLIRLDRCVSTVALPIVAALQFSISLVLCLLQEQFDNLNVFGGPTLCPWGLGFGDSLTLLISGLVTTCDLFRSRLKHKACSLSCFAPFRYLDDVTCYIIALRKLPVVYWRRTFSPEYQLVVYQIYTIFHVL